ncbi:MAG: phosphoribosylglycinamide formyltransferase [Formosimonas sp.]
MKKIVILISGGGSNMRALVEYAQTQPNARVAAVVSNVADAAGLSFAQQRGIVTAVVRHQDYAHRAAFDAALRAVVDSFSPDVVLLAGFMRILTADFTRHYARRMFNIHPSILPSFKGLHTHQAALDAGVALHGATVHGVTAELDHGPIVLQSCVAVAPDDTAGTLAARVLRTEHQIYPQMLDWWLHDRLVWDKHGIRILPDAQGKPAVRVLMSYPESQS